MSFALGLLTEPLLRRYTDLGPVAIPARPRGTAMMDRIDGNTYYVTATDAGVLSMVLLPTDWTDSIFGQQAGPYIHVDGRTFRLYVSSGVLLTEEVFEGQGGFFVYDAPVHTAFTLPTAVYRLTGVTGVLGDPTNVRVTEAGAFRVVDATADPVVYRAVADGTTLFTSLGGLTLSLTRVYTAP